MPRLRTLLLGALVLVVVVVTTLLLTLPMIVRRVAVDRLTQMTGRAVELERVEMNLFTGRVAIVKFRVAQRGSKDPALELDGVEVRVSLPSLITSHARIVSIALTGPRVYVTRLTPTEYDFSDLLALIPPPDPNAKPSTRTATVERVTITGGAVIVRDAVTGTQWKLDGLTIDGAALSTRPGPPGQLTARAKVNGTPIGFEARALDLAKGVVLAKVTLDGFDLTQLRPFVPPTIAVTPAAGRAFGALDVKVERADLTPKIALAGEARIEGLAIHKAAAAGAASAAPEIVNVGRVVVAIKDAQPLAGVIALDSVTIDGVDLRVTRLKDGRIDLLELATAGTGATAGAGGATPQRVAGSGAATAAGGAGSVREPPPPGVGSPGSRTPPAPPAARAASGAATAAPSAPAPPAPTVAASTSAATSGEAFKVTLRELNLRGAKVTFRDETVGATLALSDVTVAVRDVAWPGAGTTSYDVAMTLPGAGKLQVKGTATLAPITADFTMSMRGAPIDPYQPYIPIPGRIVGVFNGESRSKIAFNDGKLTMAVSQGRTWIDNLELRAPGATTGPIKVARVAIDGVDFTHPGKAAAKTITITKPNINVERAANGDINIRSLLAAETPPITTTRAPATTAAQPAPPPAVPVAATPSTFTSPLPLEIGAFIIEDGTARFMDRSTKPAFSEELTKLAVRIDNLSSQPGKRAKVAVQAIVGGNSALDLKGEVAPFGELYAQVSGELRNFGLSTVNPYVDTATGWGIERGKLAVKLHYTVEKNQITAQNEIIVENLHVAQSRKEDEVQKRIGLPLGMIVALITDSNNSIRVNLPITGTLDNWSADVGDAIWTVLKNAMVNIIASPFRAIGRLFTGSGDKIESVAIDPAKFAAGSATVPPEAESHLTKVADFMRKSPAIKLTLVSITTPADAETLRGHELTVRLQRVQREAKLDTLAAAVAAEFKRVFPGEPLPKTTEEQLAKLREREAVPEAAVGQLATRRLEAVRDALATKEGIQSTRLVAGDATAATTGDARVEFKIGQ